jgi:hypothetical protein
MELHADDGISLMYQYTSNDEAGVKPDQIRENALVRSVSGSLEELVWMAKEG